MYPRIIAHRCGGRLAAENSLAGLAAAARLGCRGVEFDTMLSRDGVPVLMHDDTVDRTTDGTGLVADMTVAELRACRLGDEPVPLLSEALQHCAKLGLWANVELKTTPNCDPEQLGRVVAKVLDECWQGAGIVSSFSSAALRALKGQASRYGVAMLWERLPSDWRECARELGLCGVHLDAAHVDAGTLVELRRAGLPFACYTVNDRATGDRLLAAGAAALFTDVPQLWC